jgi:hypothetical protein
MLLDQLSILFSHKKTVHSDVFKEGPIINIE